MSFNKSASTQNVDNSTKIETKNQQVGASEGSIAVGAGTQGNVTIENVDAEVLQTATDAIGSATNLAGDSIKANVLTVGRSLDSVDRVINNNQETTKAAFELVGRTNQDALSTVGSTVSEANALLSKSFEQSADILARNAGVRGSDEVKGSNTTLYVVGAIAAIALSATILGKKGRN